MAYNAYFEISRCDSKKTNLLSASFHLINMTTNKKGVFEKHIYTEDDKTTAELIARSDKLVEQSLNMDKIQAMDHAQGYRKAKYAEVIKRMNQLQKSNYAFSSSLIIMKYLTQFSLEREGDWIRPTISNIARNCDLSRLTVHKTLRLLSLFRIVKLDAIPGKKNKGRAILINSVREWNYDEINTTTTLKGKF